MKKLCITFVAIPIILLLAGCNTISVVAKDCLRIHIRADSNELKDQQVKYLIKDLTVAYLTPIISGATSKEDAIARINSEKANVKRLIDGFLKEKGYGYTARVGLKREDFPTRTYGEKVFPGGTYDALIISLGRGEGDNWWCVVYPPLCFTGEGVEYRSLIYDFIKRFFN